MTDGVMTHPMDINDSDVIDLITQRKADIEERTGHPLFIFAFSSGTSDGHRFPREMACSMGGTGVWSSVDAVSDLVSSMTGYYKLFALGLSESRNEHFTAWVEPYEFFTGGKLGTTVSAPVYRQI